MLITSVFSIICGLLFAMPCTCILPRILKAEGWKPTQLLTLLVSDRVRTYPLLSDEQPNL